MEAELKALEDKVRQTVQLCSRLRDENKQLRQELAAAQNESRRANDKIDSAKLRLETLLQHIPEAAE
jgi:cell division protein ZapB